MRRARYQVLALLCWVLQPVPAVADKKADPSKKIDGLVTGLGHASARVRRRSAQGLGRLRADAAREALRKVLQDQDPGVVVAAAVALGQLGDQEARTDLAALLAHRSRQVSRAAELALVLLDRKVGRPRYLALIQRPKDASGVDPALDARLVPALQSKLAESRLLVPGGGEDTVLTGARLDRHLKLRRLRGVILSPRIEELTTEAKGGETSVLCRVSVLMMTLAGRQLDFYANGRSRLTVGGTRIAPAQLQEIREEAVQAAAGAAAGDVVRYLSR